MDKGSGGRNTGQEGLEEQLQRCKIIEAKSSFICKGRRSVNGEQTSGLHVLFMYTVSLQLQLLGKGGSKLESQMSRNMGMILSSTRVLRYAAFFYSVDCWNIDYLRPVSYHRWTDEIPQMVC